ncbi:MAG: hypothetical protein DRR11_19025 [Gammaproteobacteria bacterium]|nr:MAG: hypothetical protein DRR11_19025 [Gammaproteobacteria bacterium]
MQYSQRTIVLLYFLSAGLVATYAAECDEDADATVRRQAEQKVVLLERLTGDADPVRRVFDSGNADAIAAIKAARELAVLARQEVDAGCSVNAAKSVAQGLSQTTRAFALARSEAVVGEQDYQALHRRTTSFLQILQSQPAELQGIAPTDLSGIQRQVSRAELMAVNGEYGEASDELGPVADRLQRRLIAIFDQQTVYYERKFASPQDEYSYLTEQYRGYRMLLLQLSKEKPLPFSGRQAYENALQDAANLSESAVQLAGDGDWQAALVAIQDALKNCEKALRLTGVMY